MKGFFEKEFTLDRSMRIIFISLTVLAIGFAILGLKSVLIPFLLALIFAYILMPLVNFFQVKLRFRYRWLAVLAVMILISGVFSIFVLAVIPAVRDEVTKTIQLADQYLQTGGLIELLPPYIQSIFKENSNIEDMIRNISLERWIEGGKEVISQLNKLISGTINVFGQVTIFFMGVLYFIFILFDFEVLAKGFVNLFPFRRRAVVKDIMNEVDGYMNSYFRGQALIALSVGILLAIGYKIIDFPLGVTLGLLIGMLNLIPYLQILGVVPIIFLSALKSAQTGQNFFIVLLVAFGVLMAVQVIQDTLLTPSIMGKKMGMRPAMILLSIAVWGSLLGFFGLLIALPLTMSLYAIYKRYVLEDAEFIDEEDTERKEAEETRRSMRYGKKDAKKHGRFE